MISFNNIGYMGRLGNQMFQFASTVGIANRTGLEAKFPIENTRINQYTGPFDPILGRNMPVKCDLLECFDIPDEFFIKKNDIEVNFLYTEHNFSYNKETEFIVDFTDMNGYFQSEKYFIDQRDLILKYFKFRDEYNQKASIYIDSIKLENPNKELTSVHVRRGDYLQYPDHHPSCPLEYYKKSMSHLSGKCDQIFILFSDDPEWCRENFSGPDFLISNLKDAYSEMCAMTMCHNNIIANSSFSWWGAWLNCENNIVIAPNKWFGPLLDKDTSDVYCKDWIKF
jgi:hypothetical protein